MLPRQVSATLSQVKGLPKVLKNYAAELLKPTQARVTVDGMVLDGQAFTGIHLAATRQMLESWPDRKLFRQIRNNYHPVRSGDIYIVQEPYWFNFDKGPVAGMHGSPWNYDTHVPVIFAGPGIPASRVHRRVQPADVAPTLAALLGMSPPASAQGNVLKEVFTKVQRPKP